MPRRSSRREELIGALQQSVRRFGGEVHRYEAAVAERLGLHATDLRCLEFIEARGPTTLRHLSDVTVLAPGALHGVVERLERAGYVHRASDLDDRRQVVIRTLPGALGRVEALHRPLLPGTDPVWDRYSDDELALILDFADRAQPVVQEGTAWLRAGPSGENARVAPPDGGDVADLRAPLDGLVDATLRFPRGAGHLVIRSDPGTKDLFRARFPSNPPTAQVERGPEDRGLVSLRYRRSPFAWRPRPGEVLLAERVRWSVEAEGGLARVVAELAGLDLRRVEIAGGVSHVSIELPPARGVVPVRLAGGVSDVTLTRPPGTAVRLRVRGGASNVVLDGRRVSTLGRDAHWASTDGDEPDQYEIEIAGGARTLVVAMA